MGTPDTNSQKSSRVDRTTAPEGRRGPFDGLLDRVPWTPVQAPKDADGLPYPTHEGTLRIGPFTLQVYQLSDGRRIVSEESARALFGEVTE